MKLSELPVGSLIKDTTSKFYDDPVVWMVLEHGHDGAGMTSLVTEKIIKIAAFDAKEPNNSDSSRRSYGNNRYLYSNLLSWLNSDAAAGSWYAAKHSQDQAPSSTTYVSNNPYSDKAGFLNGFSNNFKEQLQTVAHRTAKNTVTDGGSYEDVSSKIFLLSTTEIGLANENSVAEGTIYKYFSDSNTNTRRIAKPTAKAVSNSNYTNSSLNVNSGWYYWLRTPDASNSNNVRNVHTDGTLNNYGAYHGNGGVRPACVVPSTLSLSDTPDSDGAYTITWNAAPVITTASTALGDKNGGFSVDFTITDKENDTTTASVDLLKSDGTKVVSLLDSFSVTLGDKYTAKVSYSQLTSLEVGSSYIIRITAADASNTSVTDITFTRSESTVLLDGADGDLGIKWEPFTQTYTPNDTNGEAVTITEAIDGETVRTFAATLGQAETFDMTNFSSWGNETKHTLTVTAVNASKAEAVREWTFTKYADHLEFTTNPVETDAAAEMILALVNYDGPEFKIEATNDALAESPTWEDITEETKAGHPHEFENLPESGFGVAIRVTVTKDSTTERVYCKSAAFTFK